MHLQESGEMYLETIYILTKRITMSARWMSRNI